MKASKTIVSITKYLFLIGLWLPFWASSQTIKLSEQPQKIVKECFVLKDTSNRLPIELVGSGELEHLFRPNDGIFYDSIQTYWLCFTVENPHNRADEWLLSFDDWNFVDCYREEQGQYEHYRTGHLVPYKERHFPLGNRNFIQIIMQPHEKMRFFVRLQSNLNGLEMPSEIVFKIVKPSEELKGGANKQSITFFFVGIFLIMFFYNLFIFFSVKDISYLYYIGLLLMNVQTSVVNNGYDGLVFPSFYVTYPAHTALIANLVIGFFSVRFTLSVIKIRGVMYFLLNAIPIVLLLLSVLSIWYAPFILYNISSLIGLIMALLIFVVSLIAFLQKQKSSAIVLAGNSFFIIGIFIALSTIFGLELNLLTQNAVGIGSVGQMLMFSLVLADRINILKKENEKQQRALIKQLEENVAIQERANAELDGKVRERTIELNLANDELRQTVEELHITVAQVKAQSVEIKEQHKQITSSVRYAQRIQEAMLPTMDKFKEYFKEDFFMYFRPRDVVSGDFYYLNEINKNIVLVVADCTGHGIPGAFMSVMGTGLLNEAINEKHLLSPDLILREVYIGIRLSLKQHLNDNRDGMDMAICIIQTEKYILEYAGVHHPLVYFQDGEIYNVKADKYIFGEVKHFSKHTFSYENSPFYFYLFSDGYQDQVGGKTDKKFLSARLREVLANIHLKDLKRQKTILRRIIEAWQFQGSQPWLDDILVIGVRLYHPNHRGRSIEQKYKSLGRIEKQRRMERTRRRGKIEEGNKCVNKPC